ncbi:Uncharacterized protein Cadr_000011077 [Camelus dromedarius]|uniref:Uncharacterized protein n=1 Tax=Camelus dromedarius TaxID=9838 RepID=A0A5N4DU46_CAMDR|nr:Uncharacterized protein Cadr_000011077 [Camelus dromedarius]
MDLCQKNETESENCENNEIQSTEDTELICTCPDERSEKNHVCCLLNISDITLEQDEKAKEFIIRTGWEEAPEEKVLSVEKDECVAYANGLKTVDRTGEKRPIEPAIHHQVKETQPFLTPVTRTSLLADPKPCCLRWSLLPEKNLQNQRKLNLIV